LRSLDIKQRRLKLLQYHQIALAPKDGFGPNSADEQEDNILALLQSTQNLTTWSFGVAVQGT